MRKHFSLATVLAALALFVAMSGTAWAAVIITSNHQVGKHTIAGANAPRRDKQNLIPGSVGRTDLHNGAVNGSKVAAGSLTGANLANGSIGVAKLKIPRISFAGPSTDQFDFEPHHVLLAIDGVTFGVSCAPDGATATALQLYVKSSAGGTLRGASSVGAPNSAVTTKNAQYPVTTSPLEFAGVESSFGTQLLDGQFVYFNNGRVITLAVAGSVTFGTSCEVHGTALPAPN